MTSDLHGLPLASYTPEPSLRRELTPIEDRPPVSVVDSHNHLGRWMTGDWPDDVGELLDRMDALGIDAVINLDGMWGEELEANLDRYDRAHPGRFATFARWDPAAFASGDWQALGRGVAESLARGARGLKVWKDLGLHLRDEVAQLVMPDDERLDPVWDAVGEARVPVTIHVADPIAFFEPLDERNERLEELIAHPDWWFGDRSRFPTFDRIRDPFESLVARRSDVAWIGAHVLCSAEDLAWVERMLDIYPNAHADLGARIAELGRVPRATRELLMRHPDRFLFATDDVPAAAPGTLAVYRRFLETYDEHFPYDADPGIVPTQGRWAISGLGLPPDVLEDVYSANARRLIPGLAG